MKTWKKHTRLTDSRDMIRLLMLVNVPWIGWFIAQMFGVEHFELESELVVMTMFFVFGSFWCSWLCPFGNLNYFVGKIGHALFPEAQFSLPGKFDRPLRYLKYVWLAVFLYALITSGVNYFLDDHMEMYHATGITSWYIDTKRWFILLFPLLIPNFFCKYICFQKAAYNIINRFVPTAVIHRDEEKCIGCGKCDKVCPMGLPVSASTKIIGRDCIGCYNCVDEDVCPEKADALKLKFFGQEVQPLHLALAATILYLAATWSIMKLIG